MSVTAIKSLLQNTGSQHETKRGYACILVLSLLSVIIRGLQVAAARKCVWEMETGSAEDAAILSCQFGGTVYLSRKGVSVAERHIYFKLSAGINLKPEIFGGFNSILSVN